MKKQEGEFKFKEFAVAHSRSSMKVGVDGVLIGAWGSVEGSRGLDAGCGCGLIALMAAQRNKDCEVEAIDIDEESVAEAQLNFSRSPWTSRLVVRHVNINTLVENAEYIGKYDFILSNPPFFSAGLAELGTPREKARHEDTLSPLLLLEYSLKLLKKGGRLSMIFPFELADYIKEIARQAGWGIQRICAVADKPGKTPKRMMVETVKGMPVETKKETLFIRDEKGEYSEEYKKLTGAFYLNF